MSAFLLIAIWLKDQLHILNENEYKAFWGEMAQKSYLLPNGLSHWAIQPKTDQCIYMSCTILGPSLIKIRPAVLLESC